MTANTQNTETELVASLKNKDRQAFNYLYDNYAGALYGVIIKILDKQEVASDILQEVFVKIWRNIDSYDAGRGRLYTWMLNIARNAAIDTLRSSGYNQEKNTQYSIDNMSAHESRLSISMKTDHIGLKQLLLVLKEEHRQVIDLSYFKGYTQEEIAKELDIPLGTVKTRCRKALLQLKDIMKS